MHELDGGYAIAVTDIPTPVNVRAEATADNTSVRVSWDWQGVPMCANNVSVHYQPEGGSSIVHSVENTIATDVTLPNLQCNTKYTIWVYASDLNNRTTAFLPARGMCYITSHTVYVHVVYTCSLLCVLMPLYHSSPSHPHWCHCSVYKWLKCEASMAVD